MNRNDVDLELDIKSPCHPVHNLHVKSNLDRVDMPIPANEYHAHYRYIIVCPECGSIYDESFHMFTVLASPTLSLPNVDDGSREYIETFVNKFTATRRTDGILACPLCGKIDYVGLEKFNDGTNVGYRVACHDEDCGERGKWCDTPTEAIHNWNCEYDWDTLFNNRKDKK